VVGWTASASNDRTHNQRSRSGDIGNGTGSATDPPFGSRRQGRQRRRFDKHRRLEKLLGLVHDPSRAKARHFDLREFRFGNRKTHCHNPPAIAPGNQIWKNVGPIAKLAGDGFALRQETDGR
jgi:hypothetical protein